MKMSFALESEETGGIQSHAHEHLTSFTCGIRDTLSGDFGTKQ